MEEVASHQEHEATKQPPLPKRSFPGWKIDAKLGIFILVFAVLGTYLITRSRAADATSYVLADKATNLTTDTDGPRVITEDTGSKRNAKVVYVSTKSGKANSVKVSHQVTIPGIYTICGVGRAEDTIKGGSAKLVVNTTVNSASSANRAQDYKAGKDYVGNCLDFTMDASGVMNIENQVTNRAWRFSIVAVKLLKANENKPKDPPTGNKPNPLASLPTIPWEGGAAYYNQFSVAKAGGWSNPNFFPIGVWFMPGGSADIARYKAMNFNFAANHEDDSDVARFKEAGIFVLPENYNGPAVGNEVPGWLLRDEVDMWAGIGTNKWTGKGQGQQVCIPEGSACGLTVLQTILDGLPQDQSSRFRYANYGKGIMFWESDSDSAKMINSFTQVASNDQYWYTDPNICGGVEGPTLIKGSGPAPWPGGPNSLTKSECRRAWNYGQVVERMRELDAKDGKLQSIWNFVEVGYPGDNGLAPTGKQIEGAVMNSLIHEARGILYFKHNFGGPCKTTDIFRDCPSIAPTASLTNINGHIKDLAPVLNTQSYQYSFGDDIDSMLKWHNGSAYVFAMGEKGTTGNKTFTLPSGLSNARSVEVLYENRSINVSGSKFTDNFDNEYSYHIYKITP